MEHLHTMPQSRQWQDTPYTSVHVSGQVLCCSRRGLVVGGYQRTASIHFEVLPLEDGGGVVLLNVGSHPPVYTVT